MQGNTSISIHGENFYETNATYCKFNGTTLITPIFINTTQIICVSPNVSAEGTVEIEISNNNQDYTSYGFIYYYFKTPELRYLIPKYNIETSTEPVRIYGINFAPSPFIWCLWTVSTTGIMYLPKSYTKI